MSEAQGYASFPKALKLDLDGRVVHCGPLFESHSMHRCLSALYCDCDNDESVLPHVPEAILRQLRPQHFSFSPCRTGFNSRLINVGFQVDKVSLVQVFLRAGRLRLSPANALHSPVTALRPSTGTTSQHHITFTWRIVCWDFTLNRHMAGLTVKIVSFLEVLLKSGIIF
jgi:hypothetical protein